MTQTNDRRDEMCTSIRQAEQPKRQSLDERLACEGQGVYQPAADPIPNGAEPLGAYELAVRDWKVEKYEDDNGEMIQEWDKSINLEVKARELGIIE